MSLYEFVIPTPAGRLSPSHSSALKRHRIERNSGPNVVVRSNLLAPRQSLAQPFVDSPHCRATSFRSRTAARTLRNDAALARNLSTQTRRTLLGDYNNGRVAGPPNLELSAFANTLVCPMRVGGTYCISVRRKYQGGTPSVVRAALEAPPGVKRINSSGPSL